MAIYKAINRTSKSVAGMRNCIQYVLQDQKVKDGYVVMTGPSPEVMNWDSVFQAFREEKRIWNKESGRLYYHSVISFHKDEHITPKEALEFAQEFVDKTFREYQTLIAVHEDKDHLHIHLVVNNVSYINGSKLHTSKHDLEGMKHFVNEMCLERGLTVAQKGHHFDGKRISEGTIIAWSKDKYNKLIKKVDSFLHDCALAVIKAKTTAVSKEDFTIKMEKAGWTTKWSEKRKHLVFEDQNGNKVRDSNLTKTFGIGADKESLELQFKQNSCISNRKNIDNRTMINECNLMIFSTEERIKALTEYLEECGSPDLRKITRNKLDRLQMELQELRAKEKSIDKAEICDHDNTPSIRQEIISLKF